MECLSRLGFIDWIGRKTELLILLVDEEYQLTLAILIILWVMYSYFGDVSSIIYQSNALFFILDFSYNFLCSRFDTSNRNDGENCCIIGSK